MKFIISDTWRNSPYAWKRMLRPVYTFPGRYFERPVIHFVAVTVIVITFVVIAVTCWTPAGERTILGTDAGGDYAAFYIAGTILDEYSSDRLYDLDLQGRIYHALRPYAPREEALPYVYPPFFALIFKPLALLPYISSYVAWLFISVALYAAGLALVLKKLHAVPPGVYLTAFLLSLSFEPFIIECLAGGQSSAFGFFWICLALFFELVRRPVSSGIALGFCFYKPTLLLIIIPALIIARRGKNLLGLALCGLALAGASLVTVGWQTCLDYLQLLIQYRQAKMSEIAGAFPTWKFVDVLSFFQLLTGKPTMLTWAIIFLALAIPLSLLIVSWRRIDRNDNIPRELIWSCTLTWIPVLSLHAGIYDSIIVVPGILLTTNILFRCSPDTGRALTPGFKALLVLLYITPWISQIIAPSVGFQPYTLVLACMGGYQLWLTRRAVIAPVPENSGRQTMEI